MDARARTEGGTAAERLRRPPVSESPSPVVVRFAGDGCFDTSSGAPPAEFVIEAIGPDGQPAVWFDDYWWTGVLQRWMESALTVVIERSTGAITHPVVLHHVAMIRRVAPAWRVIAKGSAADLSGPDCASQIALSGYHEIHVCDGGEEGLHGEVRALEEVFADIRREQQRLGTQRPILVRVPSGMVMDPQAMAVDRPAATSASI